MNGKTDPGQTEDAAWVTIESPFDKAWMRRFIADTERVMRINSLMEYTAWDDEGGGAFRISGKNLGLDREFLNRLVTETLDDGVRVLYDTGLKASTTFRLEPGKTPDSSILVITDDYSAVPAEERAQRLDEVDSTLVRWGHDIHRYLRQWKRWSSVPGWRWYMNRVWLPAKPSIRRISFMLIAITTLEFITFLAVFLIFWLELDTFLD
jgi:hypothetical protein